MASVEQRTNLRKSHPTSSGIPATVILGGITAALIIDAAAGLYPAHRAARLSPTDALRAG